MFGRRRRAARAAEQADLAAQSTARAAADSTPTAASSGPLTHAQVSELLHGHLDGLIGARGVWTLVRRQSEDTDVFFHDLAAREMAATLATALSAPVTRPAASTQTPGTDTADSSRNAVADALSSATPADLTTEASAEPLALPWSPRPISRWADPSPESAAIPIPATPADVETAVQTVRHQRS